MKAVCPNSPDHKRFLTPVHLMYEAVVDETGNILECDEQLEMTHGPHTGNLWECAECGANAKVE